MKNIYIILVVFLFTQTWIGGIAPSLADDHNHKDHFGEDGLLTSRDYFDDNGKIVKIDYYENGTQKTDSVYYRKDGKIEKIDNYTDGVPQRTTVYDLDTGNIITVIFYSLDGTRAKLIHYYMDGTIAFDIRYDKDGYEYSAAFFNKKGKITEMTTRGSENVDPCFKHNNDGSRWDGIIKQVDHYNEDGDITYSEYIDNSLHGRLRASDHYGWRGGIWMICFTRYYDENGNIETVDRFPEGFDYGQSQNKCKKEKDHSNSSSAENELNAAIANAECIYGNQRIFVEDNPCSDDPYVSSLGILLNASNKPDDPYSGYGSLIGIDRMIVNCNRVTIGPNGDAISWVEPSWQTRYSAEKPGACSVAL